MRVLSASDLLDVWERAAHAGPLQQALTLLAAACPDRKVAALADLTIGERDALLLRLREATFGPRLAGLMRCPSCGEKIEIAVTSADLDARPSAAEVTVDTGGYVLRLRPPNSHDVLAVSSVELAEARAAILRRCLLSASRDGAPVDALQLPDPVIEAAEARLADADPRADIQLRLVCPACGQHATTILDIVSFFWREIDAWACRMLREVHTLASAYGWTEDVILSLTPLRRQCYLELIGP
jgi:hypothetical protein